MKNKKWVIVIVIVFIVGAGIVFLYYREPTPTTFLNIEEMTEVLIKQQDITAPITILDVLELEKSYYIVPFKTDDEQRWMSHWIFERSGWKLVGYGNKQSSLQLLQLHHNDPKSYYFVWHFPPQEEVTQMNIYFIQDRNYYISGDNQFYIPRIQLHMNIDLTDSLYGVQKIPENWLTIMAAITPIEADRFLMPMIESFPSHNFAWQTLDEHNQEAHLETGESTFTHWLESVDIHMTHVIYDDYLEKP